MKTLNFYLAAILFTLITLSNFQNCFSQYQERSYDIRCGNVSGTEFGRSIINRSDGGYAIAGYSYNPLCGIGPFDWLFLRIKPTGINESARLIGFTADDKCYSLIQSAKDSGYVLAGGMFDIPAARNRATFVKMDKSSNLTYSKRLNDNLNSLYMQVIRDPEYWALSGWDEKYIGNKLRNKLLASQYQQDGSKNWIYRYNSYVTSALESKSTEEGQSVCYQSSGTNYGVAARTNFFSNQVGIWDILVVKLSYTGNLIWKKVYEFNFPSSNYYPSTEPRKIIPMSDGGFVVVGFTNAYVQSEKDIIVFRVNSAGGLMWSNTYGSTGFLEEGNSIILDGNYLVITGSRRRSITANNALLMKIPVTGGAPLWTRIWDTATPETEEGFDLIKSGTTTSPGYNITGETYRGNNSLDAYLWKTNTNGVIPTVNCEDSTFLQYYTNPMKLDSFLLVKEKLGDKSWTPTVLDPPCNTKDICVGTTGTIPKGSDQDHIGDKNVSTITEFRLSQNYPNPFNPATQISFDLPEAAYITLKVFDAAGKEVQVLVNESKNSGRYEIDFNGENLSTGVFYYKITAGNFTQVKKMILIK